MHVKSILKFLVLAFPLSFPVLADTNLAGDEIVILNDYSSGMNFDTQLDHQPNLQNDPVLNYLPDDNSIAKYASDSNAVATDDLWQRIRSGYAMPELESQYTANHEAWYAARPDYVKRMIARSQRYLFHVVEEVQKRGMPTEIALLPMVESAFNPQAYSRSRASGMWQFIPSTGKDFGLKQNWWVDNRRDVTAATDAALTYLQKLHVMFGSWELALAAYNAGEGTVRRAIERNQKQGLPTDYESLPLPDETKNYVPKLQAVKNIMTNPEAYGLKIQPIANRPYFTKVTAPEQIDAHLAANLAEVSFEEFSALNPEYNRPVLTANGSVHEILLPIGAASTFKDNLASYDKPLVSWQTYHAKRGERTEAIARKFGISLAQLRDVNDLSSKSKLAGSQALLVPNANNDLNQAPIKTEEINQATHEANNVNTELKTPNSVRHTVKPKETVQSIARLYGVNARQVVSDNHLSGLKIKPGQQLVIASKTNIKSNVAKVQSKKLNSITSHYIVKRGDTLETIARKHSIAREDLQRWNNLKGARIAPGVKLTVSKPNEA